MSQRNIHLIPQLFTIQQVSNAFLWADSQQGEDAAIAANILDKVYNYMVELNSVQLTLPMEIETCIKGQEKLL